MHINKLLVNNANKKTTTLGQANNTKADEKCIKKRLKKV